MAIFYVVTEGGTKVGPFSTTEGGISEMDFNVGDTRCHFKIEKIDK